MPLNVARAFNIDYDGQGQGTSEIDFLWISPWLLEHNALGMIFQDLSCVCLPLMSIHAQTSHPFKNLSDSIEAIQQASL